MCGICGIVGERSQPAWPAALERMTDVIRHRGPDDQGHHLEPGVALGHRRLSIIDLSPAGHQPMTNEDGTLWLTYNGEIYNHRESARELVARGPSLPQPTPTARRSSTPTRSGATVASSASAACSRSRSGIAARSACWLARDRLGVKPLYYAVVGRHAGVRARRSRRSWQCGLVSAAPAPGARPGVPGVRLRVGRANMFAGIRKLPPGHVLTWQHGAIAITQYWDVEFGAGSDVAGVGGRLTERVPAHCSTSRSAAADERRAARRVPQRRPGLERHRRGHAPARSAGG